MHGSSHICPMCRCTGCIFMHAIWTSALTPWGFPHAAVQNNSNKTPAALYALTRSACMHKSWEIDFQLKVCCKGWDWSAWSSQAVPWLTVTPPISRKNAQRAHRSQLLHMVKISYVQKLNGPNALKWYILTYHTLHATNMLTCLPQQVRAYTLAVTGLVPICVS